MKYYQITFWRSNPQLANGGYERAKYCRAKTEEGAMRKADKWRYGCCYGGYSILDIQEVGKEEFKVQEERSNTI